MVELQAPVELNSLVSETYPVVDKADCGLLLPPQDAAVTLESGRVLDEEIDRPVASTVVELLII